MTVLQRLHDLMVDIRWYFIERAADREEAEGEVFDNAEDLIKDLRNPKS